VDNVRLTLADAAAHAFAPGAFDLAFSRFGVMFFDDPDSAFANIRAALVATGRLAFVCWASPQDNPWLTVPLRVARSHLPPQPESDPAAPGPFAFADPDRVSGILKRAGYTVTVDSTFVRSREDGERRFEVRVGHVETKAGTDFEGLIRKGLDAVGGTDVTALTAFTDGWPGLRGTPADAGVLEPPILD
jgi:SAM-dependent methyltransferase